MPFRSIFDLDPGDPDQPQSPPSANASFDQPSKSDHTRVLFGDSGDGWSNPYISDYDKPLVQAVKTGLDKLATSSDPEDAWAVSQNVEDIQRSSPHLEPHLPARALDIQRTVHRAYSDEADKFAAAGRPETPDDRAGFRRAAGVAGLDWYREASADSDSGPRTPQQPPSSPSPALPIAAATSTAAATWPGAEAGPGGSLIFRPQPGATTGEGGSTAGEIAGKAAMSAAREVAPKLAGILGMLIPSPGVEREITPLGDGLRFSVPTGEQRGRVEQRDPGTGQWNPIGPAEMGIDPQGHRFIRADPPPAATPPSPPVSLPDRQITVPPPPLPPMPGSSVDPQEPPLEEFPAAEPSGPDIESFPADEEFSGPSTMEARRYKGVPSFLPRQEPRDGLPDRQLVFHPKNGADGYFAGWKKWWDERGQRLYDEQQNSPGLEGRVSPADSYIWNAGRKEGVPDGTRHNGQTGSHRIEMEWDRTHGEIEVYDGNRQHLGAINPLTGQWVKGPKAGRERTRSEIPDDSQSSRLG